VARPLGVKIVALLQTLNAVTHSLSALAGIEAPGFGARVDFTLVVLITGAGLLVALGLLTLKRWAWIAAQLWLGVVMAVQTFIYLRDGEANYVIMLLSVAQVLYLNLPEVQASFQPVNRSKPAR
jgi:hypothetical protein